MAGVLVGSAVLSSFFNVLLDRAATREFLKFLLPDEVINFERLLWELKGLLWSADVLMDDAEEKRIHDKRVEEWLTELKDVVFKAGEVVDKIETEALRLKMEGGQSTSLFSTHVKSELEEILSSLKFLLERKEELGLQVAGTNRSSDVRTRLSERPTPFVHESDFCGREGIKETIMQSLRSAEVGGDKVSVIPVIGAGGLGKTTLVQIIYDHPAVKQLFGEVRAWVTVSTEFDLSAITKVIIRKVSSSSRINGDENQKELLDKLRDALTGKKFLLVLDDVWSEKHRVKWESLKSCFKSGESGSKIIVTTRSRKVALIMAPNQQHHLLEELPEKDCLKLFAQTVFGDDEDSDAYPDLQEIGKKIVHKCKGNPLSVRSVGGILCGERNPEKWEKILESSLWELLQEDNEDIIPSLWLSYLYLPSEVKPCFAYCSIFAKDYEFQKEVVVQLWMAEGFLKNEAGKRGITMEEVGKRYFEELISRSLFQRSKEWYRGEGFIMHDLVHDLAMNVSEEFCFCLEGEKNLRDLSCKTRYLSCNMQIQDVKKSEDLSKARRLHSFVGLDGSTEIGGDILKLLEESAMKGGCLRVLSLPSVYITKSLPDSIGNLKHLRYLNLSETEVGKLPDSVGTLYNLQTLLLSSCFKLTQLPSTMGRLINLRHLDTRDSPLEEMPPHMCNLTKLQTLSDFVVGKRGSSIRDLGALHDLNGELRISGLQNVDDVLKGNLEDKKNLSKLVLEWEGQTDDSIKDRTVLDALQPHTNLKELVISNYGGTSFPDWVGDSLFLRIERMHLNGCQDCFSLPSLGKLPSLKELKMKGFHLLETIGDGFYGNDSPFKSLKVLHFEDMPEWKRWSVVEVPRLERLTLMGCPKLVGGLPNCNTIRTLHVDKCKNFDFPGNQCRYPSLERLYIKESCGSMKSFPLNHFPKLNTLHLKELKCLVELIGESHKLKWLFIEECPKLEFTGNSRYGSLENLMIKKCEALKSIPLDYFPKLIRFTLEELECLIELTGDSPDELEELSIIKCPKLEFTGNGRYGSLENLKIKKCEALKSIPLDYFPKLNKLDLKELECLIELTGYSPDELKEFSIMKCPKLEFLGNSHYGSLENLKIGKCEALKSIPLDYFPKLNRFNLWNCQNFESFRFAEEPPLVLESLSLCKLPKFVSFPEGGLPAPSLKAFRIEECENLRSLPQQMHGLLPSLNNLRVVNCGEIESWPEGGLPSNLESLEIWGCKKLAAQVMHWDLQVTCLKSLEIDGCGEELLDSFPPEGLLPTSLTSLEIRNFRRLKTLNIHAFQNLRYLTVEKCEELRCLPEESLPNSLVRLDIYNCPLLERRYRKETGEGWHKISHIPKVLINLIQQH
ncbi:hypothetical protein UlMin_007536 [Ulmus minor]